MTTRRTVLAGLAAVANTALPFALTTSPVSSPTRSTSESPPAARTPAGRRPAHPLVIGHRGASGYRPEHTLAAYELAARLGADYLEPDLVVTKDGVLVCRHEPEIGGTTDVADHAEFADRRKTALVDGVATTGWFTEDFTLAELRTLRATERLPQVRQRNTLWNNRFTVPTFVELLDLRRRLSRELGRELGVYPETKHPIYFERAGLALEPRLLDALRGAGLNTPTAPVVVQSFEVGNLRRLRRLGLRARAVQLIAGTGSPYDTVVAGTGPSYADLADPAGLASIAGYAQGIGPDKGLVIPRGPDGTLQAPTALVRDAHAAGLVVHPYTFRAENTFLPANLRVGSVPTDYGRAIDEQVAFLAAGVDGLFTDQPDIAVAARSLHRSAPATR